MNRGVITISESGTVSMPTDTVCRADALNCAALQKF